MNKYEVINNGEHTGVIIEAPSMAIARNNARKLGYRCFMLEDQWEKEAGKPEYNIVIKYFITMEAIAHDLALEDNLATNDIMMALASAGGNDTNDTNDAVVKKPTKEVIEKAITWARTTGKVAFDEFKGNLRKYNLI